MKLDSKSPECRKFLVKLMDQLETVSVNGSRSEARLCVSQVMNLLFVVWFNMSPGEESDRTFIVYMFHCRPTRRPKFGSPTCPVSCEQV